MKSLAILPFSLASLLVVSLSAQDVPIPKGPGKEPEELAQMRKQYATRALQNATPLAEQFSAALTTVIKETGAAGDYDQALAAQRRRESLIDLYSKALTETKLTNVIVLKPADARVTGTVNYDRPTGELVNWKSVGSSASWDISRIIPGSYDIVVTYSVADIGDTPVRNNPLAGRDTSLETGGEFEFFEDTSLTGSAANHRTAQVTSTGGWATFGTLSLAPIQLNRSSARFALKITRARGEGGIMHLKEIRLVPVKAANSDQATPATPANGEEPLKDDFAKLKEAYLTRVKSVVPPVLSAYTSKLKSLGSIASAKNDPELTEIVNSEITRTQSMMESPETAAIALAGTSGSLQGSGFEEWKNVHYKPSPKNGGDRFLVDYKGQDIPVRLLSVTTPLLSAEAVAHNKLHATYFGISEEDTVDLAKRAREFTEAFLQNKPFRIYTRGMKDPEGLLFVNVVPDGVGDYAGVLVDNGLAAINNLKAKLKEGKVAEESTLIALREREAAAKARPIPPGAWALVPEAPLEKK
ncbi:hypothetical protein BH11VER1_BH11VER1_27610 [soil metagenome]